jgi:hypothetical protein
VMFQKSQLKKDGMPEAWKGRSAWKELVEIVSSLLRNVRRSVTNQVSEFMCIHSDRLAVPFHDVLLILCPPSITLSTVTLATVSGRYFSDRLKEICAVTRLLFDWNPFQDWHFTSFVDSYRNLIQLSLQTFQQMVIQCVSLSTSLSSSSSPPSSWDIGKEGVLSEDIEKLFLESVSLYRRLLTQVLRREDLPPTEVGLFSPSLSLSSPHPSIGLLISLLNHIENCISRQSGTLLSSASTSSKNIGISALLVENCLVVILSQLHIYVKSAKTYPAHFSELSAIRHAIKTVTSSGELQNFPGLSTSVLKLVDDFINDFRSEW